MKLFTSKSNSKNYKILKLAAVGMMLLSLAVLMMVIDPLRRAVDWQLALGQGTLLHYLWLTPPVEVFIMVYMFNYTNAEAFISGKDDKLKLEELGPYVYQEILEHHNVSFNANNTVSFMPRRHLKFIRERSVGDPHLDRVVAPNIPYMGLTTAAASLSVVAAIALSALTRRLNSRPMINVTVHDYLYGYEDHLVHLASKFVPSFIDFQSFGILERMFDEGDNLETMNLPTHGTKVSKNVRREYSIDNWNGAHGLNEWHFRDNQNATYCNKLQGVYDTTLFPRDIHPDDTLYVFRRTFCRPLPIRYSKPVNIDGIAGYQFKLDANTFDTKVDDPNTSCFCRDNKCLKKGLAPVTPCYYNIPLAISFPHYKNGDPSLLEPFEGLQPDEEKHGSTVVVQPQLGVPMHVHTRFQANQVIGEVRFNKEMSRFAHKALPLLWVDVTIEKLPVFVVILLKILFNVCPVLQSGTIIVLGIAGVWLLSTALRHFCWHTKIDGTSEQVGRKLRPMKPLVKQSYSSGDNVKDEAQLLPTFKGSFAA